MTRSFRRSAGGSAKRNFLATPLIRVPRFSGAMLLLLATLAAAACKTPRAPDQVATGDLTGTWTAAAESREAMRWRIVLEEHEGGRLSASGAVTSAGETREFVTNGIRDASSVQLDLEIGTFDGSIRSVDSLVGNLYLPGDTVPLTFQRE
jgi:hypothetical protein